MAPTTYQYPENYELKEIEAELMPVLTMGPDTDPIFRLMPIVDVDAHLLEWEQEDSYYGLQQLRGLDGQPGNVRAVGANRYRAEPGVYGDFLTVDEEEMTTRRRPGNSGQAIDVSDLVRRRQEQLLHRRINRIRQIGWTLLTTGTFSVSSRHGVVHTDTYDTQDYNASTWATVATATPLADFRGAQLLSRGKGVSFGAGSEAFMNRQTANYLLANTNAADLGGKRTSGLANILSMAEVNNVLGGEDLPAIRIWDDTYQDNANATQLFIPNGKVVIVGRRTGGVPIMDYAMTRNANNPDAAPGPYMFVKDRTGEVVPPVIEVHDGHNGGPRIYFPSAVINMDVS